MVHCQGYFDTLVGLKAVGKHGAGVIHQYIKPLVPSAEVGGEAADLPLQRKIGDQHVDCFISGHRA